MGKAEIKGIPMSDKALLRFVSVLAQSTVEVLHKKGVLTHEEVVEEMDRFARAYEEQAAKEEMEAEFRKEIKFD